MSTPIQQDEVSPNDPKFYAPPKWRSGETDTPPVHPFLKAPALPSSPASADGTSRHNSVSLALSRSESAEGSDAKEYKRVRTTALACAVGVVVWIAFCITTGLARLDTSSSTLASTNGPEISLDERLQAANTALDKVSRPALAPTLVVADASGVVNAAIPLAVKVTNYTPYTTVNLSGLAAGTMLSSGARAEEGQWRVAIDDLPHTRVIPPPEYVGAMTIVAELRGGDDRPIVRTPVRLTWRPTDAESTAAVGAGAPLPSAVENPAPSDLDDSAAKPVLFGESPVSQNDSTITQPRPHRARRHMSNTAKGSLAKGRRQRNSPAAELQTDVYSQLELRSSLTDNLFANADSAREQRFLWFHDVQTNGDPDEDGAKECQSRAQKRGVEKRVQHACRQPR